MARDARDADSEASDEIAHAFDLTAEGRARWYARLERDVGLNT